ncbi:MAG: hypothetical protein ACYC2R_04870 [Burkholderiales bacterium]|nr:hypothetical protein [Sulfuricellaceae bacterium]
MAYGQEKGGFYYWVSEEQMEAFGRLSDLERLKWLEEAWLFTVAARTPETARRQDRLRQGLCISGKETPP